MACTVCEHCDAPVDRQHCAMLEGYSYHDTCRKCYVCSETDLVGAEVFNGVIFCSGCSQRIFQGCSTARRSKTVRRTRDKSHKRRQRIREKTDCAEHPQGILAMTGLIASSGSSKSCSDATRPSPNSKTILVSAEMALTVANPTYHEAKSITRNSAEVGMTTEVTQQLLKELNCPVVTRYQHKKPSEPCSPTSSPHKKRSPCSDLRVAELGTSREIANMALRHKNEVPVIIKSDSHCKHMTSASESNVDNKSDSGERHEEWMDSAYSTLDDSVKSQVMERRFRSILRKPFYAFKRNILNRSSLICDKAAEDSGCILQKIKTAFCHECTSHQRRGLKRLYSTINRKKAPNKLGWLNLMTNVYCTHSNSVLRLSNDSYRKRCKHFHKSHSYRCMRAQAMKLAGPTKSELAVLRRKIRNLISPGFVRNVAISYGKRPAIMMSHGCGCSKPASIARNNENIP